MAAQRIDWPAWMDWYASSGTPTRTQNSGAMGGGYMNADLGDGAWASWQQVTAAGTFTLHVIYATALNAAKFQMSVDGVDKGALTDAYAGSTVYNNVLSIADIALTEGVHTIRMTANGKNASSASFRFFPQWFSLEIQ